MADTKWTEAMDGSPADVDLFGAAIVNGLHTGSVSVNDDPDWGRIVWQHGPVQEVGRNGILLEELLEYVVIPRLQGFNRDQIPDPNFIDTTTGGVTQSAPLIPNPFRNRESSLAITHLQEALLWLKHRTELRRKQRVEGTFRPHVS